MHAFTVSDYQTAVTKRNSPRPAGDGRRALCNRRHFWQLKQLVGCCRGGLEGLLELGDRAVLCASRGSKLRALFQEQRCLQTGEELRSYTNRDSTGQTRTGLKTVIDSLLWQAAAGGALQPAKRPAGRGAAQD